MLNWYLVYTKPKCEDIVSLNFNNFGLEVLNPKIREQKHINGRLQYVTAPLFSCYVFVRFELSKHFQNIKYTRGVRNIVMGTSGPAVVGDDTIKSIADRMENGVCELVPRKYREGEEIIINHGPFSGFEAIFYKVLKGPERVKIFLKALQAHLVVDSFIFNSVQ